MGYSASVSCKSVKASDQLYDFLKKNMVSWSILTEGTKIEYNPDYDYTRFIKPGENLSYGSSPTRVGFDFSTQGPPGHYMWTILRWAAFKVGRVSRFPKKLGHNMPVPYVTCDIDEYVPVITIKQWVYKDSAQYVVDKLGFKSLSSKNNFDVFYYKDVDLHNKIVKDAMKELDRKWNERKNK